MTDRASGHRVRRWQRRHVSGRAWEASGVVIAGFCNRRASFHSIHPADTVLQKPANIGLAADYALMAMPDEVVFDLIEQLPSHLPCPFQRCRHNPNKGGSSCARVRPLVEIGHHLEMVIANDEAERDALTALAGPFQSALPNDRGEAPEGTFDGGVWSTSPTTHSLWLELAKQAELPWDWFVPMIEAMSQAPLTETHSNGRPVPVFAAKRPSFDRSSSPRSAPNLATILRSGHCQHSTPSRQHRS